jgi:hypothetical protein
MDLNYRLVLFTRALPMSYPAVVGKEGTAVARYAFRNWPSSRKNIASRKQLSHLKMRTGGRSKKPSMAVTREIGPLQSAQAGGSGVCTAFPFLGGSIVVLLLHACAESVLAAILAFRCACLSLKSAARLTKASWTKKSVAVVAIRNQSCALWRLSSRVGITVP